jgi:hypothetical protein
MGNYYQPTSDPPLATASATRDPAEQLARIGLLLDAQRVEIYRAVHGEKFRRSALWTAQEFRHADLTVSELPAMWFPWSLGNVRPLEWVFVRNAATLPLTPNADVAIGDLNMASALHLPLEANGATVGATCVLWSTLQTDWRSGHYDRVLEWSIAALDACG